MNEDQTAAAKRAGCLASIILTGLLILPAAGYFIASPVQLAVVSIIWVMAVALIAAAVVTVFWGAAAYVWMRVRNIGLIYPDENGDLPIIRVGRNLVNLNLVPYHTYKVTREGQVEVRDQDNLYPYRAWMIYLATRGKTGSPPAAAFNPARQMLAEPEPEDEALLVTQPGQSRLVDTVAQEL